MSQHVFCVNSALDVDECSGLNNCDKNAICTNEIGSYSCQCIVGFNGVGMMGNCTGKFAILRSVLL